MCGASEAVGGEGGAYHLERAICTYHFDQWNFVTRQNFNSVYTFVYSSPPLSSCHHPRVARALVRYYAGKGMSTEDARRVRHEIFIRSILLMGSRVGKLAEVAIVSRGAAAPMGRIMSFVDIPSRREVFEEAQTLNGHTSCVYCVTHLDDGRIVSGSADNTLIVWEAGDDGTFAAAQTLSGHTGFVLCVAQLDDGRIVSGSDDKTLIVWAKGDDGAFAAAQTLSGHTGYVNCVAPLDDGRLVSGSYDKTLIVWAAGDDGAFAAAQTLSGHTSAVWCVAPLDDGRLVSGSCQLSWDKTLKVWE